jgi:uncharacterized protein (UPF0248 family)
MLKIDWLIFLSRMLVFRLGTNSDRRKGRKPIIESKHTWNISFRSIFTETAIPTARIMKIVLQGRIMFRERRDVVGCSKKRKKAFATRIAFSLCLSLSINRNRRLPNPAKVICKMLI